MGIRLSYRLLFYIVFTVFCLNFVGAQIIIDLESGDTTNIGSYQHQFDSSMLDAAVNNRPDELLKLLNKGADPEAKSGDGITALMYAAELGHLEVMKILLLNGAGVETSYFEGASPLIFAVRENQFEAAKLLLEKGANPNARDNYGLSPLIYAAALNEFEIADLLIFYGADKELADREKNTPLMSAVYFGCLETADVLLQNGVNPDRPDIKGNTPLLVASQVGDTSMINLLLEYGASPDIVNKANYTPLATAVRYKFPEATRILASRSADVNYRISPQRTLLDLSNDIGCDSCSMILTSLGAHTSKIPDFSQINLSWGNSFGRSEYMMQTRVAVVDSKFGFYFQTGFDFRPAAQKIQIEINDLVNVQYMERRLGWSHGIGKTFKLWQIGNNAKAGLFLALNGYLSFPEYRGFEEKPAMNYTLIPSAGALIEWPFFGFTAGMERYQFGTLFEGNLKANITAYVRFTQQTFFSGKKEIIW